MKIAKSNLKQIIKEELAHPRHDLGKNVADAEFPIVVGYKLNGRAQSEIAYNQDELDDILDMIAGGPGSRANIPYSLDSLTDVEPESIPSGKRIERYTESTAKITKRQLKRIIRESIDDWGMGPDVVGKSGRSYGADSKDDGSYFRDVIVMSPNGDSVLVDGKETYIQDVPMQLELMGFPMSDIDADNLIFALEESMADGYVELEVKYENGVWSW